MAVKYQTMNVTIVFLVNHNYDANLVGTISTMSAHIAGDEPALSDKCRAG